MLEFSCLKIFVGLVDLRPCYVFLDTPLFFFLKVFQLFAGSLLLAQASQHRCQLKSRFARRTRYAPKEKTLSQMNRWLVQRYRSYGNVLEARERAAAAGR